MTSRVALILLLSAARATVGQINLHPDTVPPKTVLLPWPLLDLVLVRGSAGGFELLAAPSLMSTVADVNESAELGFDPAAARAWVKDAEDALRSLPDSGPSDMRAVVPMLTGSGEATGLGLARMGTGDGRKFVLIIKDGHSGWRAEGVRSDVDTMLAVLDRVAQASLLIARQVDSTPSRHCQQMEPPERISGPMPRYPTVFRDHEIPGRVWLQFVLDTAGHVERTTLIALLSSANEFAQEALRVILDSRYRPGYCDKVPVRVLVRQPMSFRIGR